MIILLFSLTTGISALLMFTIQPMLAKLLLPSFGGTPAVWYATLFFFQSILLCGYCYVHFFYKAAQRWGMPIPSLIHLVALTAIALITLPLPLFSQAELAAPASGQALAAVWMLARWVALPVFFLCCTAPLIQHWFHTLPQQRASDPYFLYSASNAGSFVGLFLFPLALEPWLGSPSQLGFWSYSYGVYAILLAGCCSFLLHHTRSEALKKAAPKQAKISAPSVHQRIWWVVLAFVPSSLLIGATNHITQDIASLPLLWVLPLAVYLATFIIAYTKYGEAFIRRSLVAQVSLNITMMLFYSFTHIALVLLHLFTFFANAMVCHGLLARQRPPARFLSEYYIWIGLGGVLGSLFNLFIAPLIFTSYIEYALMLIIAMLLPQFLSGFRPRFFIKEALIGTALALALLLVSRSTFLFNDSLSAAFSAFLAQYIPFEGVVNFFSIPNIYKALLIFAGYFLALRMQTKVVRCAAMLPWLFILCAPALIDGGTAIYKSRNFFGLLKVIDSPNGNRSLMHGTTIHGLQKQNQLQHLDVGSYYAVLRDVIDLPSYRNQPRNVGLIGLGTGSSACLLRPSDHIDIFEINPLVIEVASDPRYFTFLQNCAPEITVFLGDGRQEIATQDDARYHVIIVDAFSSDAIPIHLITQEAAALYQKKLVNGGSIAFHISNRHVNLIPLVRGLAQNLGAQALFKFTPPKTEMHFASSWAVITSDKAATMDLVKAGWEDHAEQEPTLWTDEYSSLLFLLRP